MFGKLLKYEFKSIGKWYFALNGGIIAIAALLSFVIKVLASENTSESSFNFTSQLIPLTLILVFGALIAGSLLATLLIIINRFNKNIFGREGYLTMTLPVSEHHLILSKLLSSFIWSVFNFLILGVATAILVLPQVQKNQLSTMLAEIGKSAPQYFHLIIYAFVYFILSTIAGILSIYLAISVGQLFSNRRGLKAFVAYFAIQILLSIIFTLVNTHLLGMDPSNTELDITSNYYFLVSSLEMLVQILIYYVGTHVIIKHKLNLQ